MATSRSWNTQKARAKPIHQPFGVWRFKTISEMRSVMVPRSCPGAISRSCSA